MTKSNFRPIGRNFIPGRQTCWGTSQNRAWCGALASLSEQGVHSGRIPRGDRGTDREGDFGRSPAVFPACQRSREAAVRPKILLHARRAGLVDYCPGLGLVSRWGLPRTARCLLRPNAPGKPGHRALSGFRPISGRFSQLATDHEARQLGRKSRFTPGGKACWGTAPSWAWC